MSLRLGNGVIVNTTSSTGTPVTGFLLPIGNPNTGDGDGSLDDGAIQLTETMSVSNAIDQINEYILRLLPLSPTPFPNGLIGSSTFQMGQSPLLCDGTIPDNTNGGTLPSVAAGDDVSENRGVGATFNSTALTENGFGDSGSVAVYYNNTKGGELVFTANVGDSLDSNGLEITNDNWFPITQPNFFQSFDAKVKGAPVQDGWNRYRIEYTDSLGVLISTNELYLLKDNLTTAPSYTNGTLSESTGGSLRLISGLPHYQSGAVLNVAGASINELTGYTYTNDDPLEVSSVLELLFPEEKTYSYSDLGITTPLSVGNTSQAISVDITLDANDVHCQDNLKFRPRNVNGEGNFISSLTTNILYAEGASSNISESQRVDLGVGDTTLDAPAVGGLPSAPTPFPSNQDLSDPSYTSEAVIVGGVIKHDLTDYTNNFLPVGSDYSGKKIDSQYIDFVFTEASRSNVSINIVGTYSGLWIGLEGYSDDPIICPNSVNQTWWNGFEPFGSGLPGRLGASAGCADGIVPNGFGGNFNFTFGYANTSKNSDGTNASTSKNIFVRVKLDAGQSIENLTIS